jgi:hypothetical protein
MTKIEIEGLRGEEFVECGVVVLLVHCHNKGIFDTRTNDNKCILDFAPLIQKPKIFFNSHSLLLSFNLSLNLSLRVNSLNTKHQ